MYLLSTHTYTFLCIYVATLNVYSQQSSSQITHMLYTESDDLALWICAGNMNDINSEINTNKNVLESEESLSTPFRSNDASDLNFNTY